MKFEMSGVKIDLLFAQQQQQWVVHPTGGIGGGALSKKSVIADGDGGSKGDSMGKKLTPKKRASEEMDEEIELDDSFLVGLDEASVRSVNGVRVAQFLLRAVGDSNEGGGSISEEVGSANGKNEEDAVRLENFRWTLRSVKEWARVNGLYSNVLGFLGGVNWAILVCWICKRNPEAPASMLLRLFFRTYATWKWPKPVSLSHTNKRPPKGVNALPVWSPRDNYRDATHLMPIITPCYPCMNSSYNVGEPQLRRIRDEFSRANLIVDGIVSHRSKSGWDDLFECNDFFRQHDRYLQVNIIGSNEDDFRAWFGLCESKMRILIAGLESPQHGVQAYPFAEFFHHKKDAETDAKTGENHPPQHIASFFIALRFAFDGSVELGPLASDFLNVVNSWEGRDGGMELNIHNVPQKRLPAFVFDRCRWQRKEEEREQKVVEAEAVAVMAAKKADGEEGPADDNDRRLSGKQSKQQDQQPDGTKDEVQEFISHFKKTRISLN